MPRKVFVAGEILTAADVNTNLMDQAVMVFDDATARTTAIPTPVEGMTTYLKDLDAVEFFDGSVFRRVGGLIAVKSAINTGPEVYGSVGAGAYVAVDDLSITHEVSDPSNKLIISAYFGIAATNQRGGEVGIAVFEDSSVIGCGLATSSRTPVSAGGRVSATSSTVIVTMPSVTFVHTPGAGSKTYTVRAANLRNASSTILINRDEADTNEAARPRSSSSLVIQEVAV